MVSSLISGYQHYLLQRTGTAVVYSSRRKLIARILHLPISEFDARRTGDLVSRVGTDTTLLYAVLTQGLADAVGNALIFVGALVAMAIIDPVLLALIIVRDRRLGRGRGRCSAAASARRRPSSRRRSASSPRASSAPSARSAPCAPSGATEREVASVIDARDGRLRASACASRRSRRSSCPIAGIALQVSLLVVLGVGGFRVASGAITIARLVTFIMFLFMMIAPLGSTFGAITSVNQALGALGRIQEVLDLPTEEQGDAKIAVRARGRPGRGRMPSASASAPAIAFRDVRFRYPENVVAAREAAATEARAVLEQVHLERRRRGADRRSRGGPRRAARRLVRRAARLARRAGRPERRGQEHDARRSSSGSTTRPAARSSSTAATSARSTATQLRAQFGYVEQDAPTLAGTIADNLRLGSPDGDAMPTASACCTP